MLFWSFFAIIQLLFWGVIFQRLAWYKAPVLTPNRPLPKASVVICARNEGANLQKNLESILLQAYSTFEVLVVNDDSSDNTAQILEDFQVKYANLVVITIQNKSTLGKKNALAKGLEAAQYEWVLLTDADCYPNSSLWIASMLDTAISNQKEIVLGYAPYIAQKTWLNRWVQFETVFVAIQYLSFALWGRPYMGVGRNLLYKKSLFFENDGFVKHQHITSGDDDLFINEVATNKNTRICLRQESFMYSNAPTTWRQLYRQKTRHYSSSSHYKLTDKLALGALSLSHFIFYVGIIVFLVGNLWNYAILLLIILRTILFGIVFYKYLKTIQNLNLFVYIWVLDSLLPIYYLVFTSALFGATPQKWK